MEAELVARMRRVRKAAALTQEALGEKMGMPGPTISDIETQKRGIALGEFVRWCEACGASPAAVLNGEALTVTVPITESA